jgi:hypothetical protein
MGCGVLFALIVIVVALALTFGPPAFIGNWEETPVEIFTPEEKPPSSPDKKTQEKKNEETKPVTIRVTGTPGVSFSGAYAARSAGSIDGVTPQDFAAGEVRSGMDGVTANVQKRSEGNDELTLQVLVDGEVVQEQSTTAQSGVVTVTLFPEEI